jgi:hypothetical protein
MAANSGLDKERFFSGLEKKKSIELMLFNKIY